jgi:hypothetical protein
MADDIDEIMNMIQNMETPDPDQTSRDIKKNKNSIEKHNIRKENPARQSLNELSDIMKSIEDIENMPTIQGNHNYPQIFFSPLAAPLSK